MDGNSEASEPPVRDRLALVRTRLANERTMLAYVRTAIMLAATGATLTMLYGDSLSMTVSGWVLIVAAASVAGFGAMRFQRLARSLC